MIQISRGSKPGLFTIELNDGEPQSIVDMSTERATQIRDALILFLGLPEGSIWKSKKVRPAKERR